VSEALPTVFITLSAPLCLIHPEAFSMSSAKKHNVHKFRELPKLDYKNWPDWKDLLKSVARERGLWKTIAGTDICPTRPSPEDSSPPDPLLLADIEDWEDRDGAHVIS
jgi:hypothetical protein